jgi:hypothetical protein
MISVSRQILDRYRAGDTVIGRLATIRRAIASGLASCSAWLLAALHASRRKQAAAECARYRHLIHDPETGTCFGINPIARADDPLRS